MTPSGEGYWIASLEGAVYTFGDAVNLPPAPLPAGHHTAGIAAAPGGAGYWLATADGLVAALPGEEGAHVRAVQEKLTALGYWMGPTDGHTGALMAQAVMAFQKYNRMPRTGVADQTTVEAINVSAPPTRAPPPGTSSRSTSPVRFSSSSAMDALSRCSTRRPARTCRSASASKGAGSPPAVP